MPAPDARQALVRRWRSRAHDDLLTAHLADDSGDVGVWVACFHSQQAAEKQIKAVIASTGAEPSFTHNLIVLLTATPGDYRLTVTPQQLGLLTTYAATARYVLEDVPEEEDPTRADARDAIAWAESIARESSIWLRDRGFDLTISRKPR